MMERIKIGQIGICHEHAAKIQSLRRMPGVFEFVGVVDDRASSAARFAGEDLKPYEGMTWLTEDELFHTPGLQAVMVETANTDLVPTAVRCMEHGLAIHMDKPAGEDYDLANFRALLDGCKEKNLPFQVGYMFRNNPAIQLSMRAVRENWLGDIFEVQASMSHDYGGESYQDYLASFKGGIMFNLGCHLIDFIVHMLGRPERITPVLKSAPGYPDTIKNNCLTILAYPHATATLRACSLEVGGIGQRRLKICGTKGTIDLCPLERFDGKPLEMHLTLSDGNEEYAAGTHTVNLGVVSDRYQDQARCEIRIATNTTIWFRRCCWPPLVTRTGNRPIWNRPTGSRTVRAVPIPETRSLDSRRAPDTAAKAIARREM